jgi:hypothetical protein
MSLSRITLGITIHCITIKMPLGLVVKNVLLNDPIFLIMLSVIMINVTAPSFLWPNQGSLLEGEVGLLELTSLDQLLLYIENIMYLFTKTSYLYEEVHCTEPSPSVSIPWSN